MTLSEVGFLSRLSPVSRKPAFLVLRGPQTRERRRPLLLLKITAWTYLLLILVALFQLWAKHNFGLLIALLLLPLCFAVWRFLHTQYSPIPKYRLEWQVKKATQLLGIYPISWRYWLINDKTYIEGYLGTHYSMELVENLPIRLTACLIEVTRFKKEWELQDVKNNADVAKLTFVYGKPRKRLEIHSIDDLDGQIRLDSELVFTPDKQVHLLCVGRTGSGKTTFLKVLLLQTARDKRNKFYLVDGKSAYFSTLAVALSGSKLATDGKSLLAMLREINEIIKERYTKAKALDNERDTTYLDFFPDEGRVFLFFDEILAMFSLIEASDKIKKPAERLLPQIQAELTEILQLGRAANVHAIISGQQIPATILPTSSREAMGARVVLGRIDPINAQEILGVSALKLPKADTSNFGALVWLEGYGWDKPKIMQLPYLSDSLSFKAALKELTQ